MRSQERLRAVARAVRRVPGYETARTEWLPRLQQNDTYVDLLRRAIGRGGGLGQGPETIRRAGTLGAGPGGLDSRYWPVVVVDLVDLGADRVGPVVEEVAALQREHPAFHPVFLLGACELGAIRSHGYPWELLPPGASVADRCRRVLSIIDHYVASLVWTIGPEGTSERERLEAETLYGYLTDRVEQDRLSGP